MIDFDRVYEPEQLDQLEKDLAAARQGQQLDIFERASIRRWRRQGISARIRRLPDRRLTCWPSDLPTSPGLSHVGGTRVSPAEAMAHLRGEKDHKVSVGIYFDKTDLDLLRAAAFKDTEPGYSIFDRAADSIERQSYLVVRVMGEPELRDIVARFRDEAGIVHLTLDTLRVGSTPPVRM